MSCFSCAGRIIASLQGVFITLLVGCLLLENSAKAAELAKVKDFLIKQWDMEDGLPGTRINAVARTHNGYVWMATDGGLVRFDGDRFTTFTTNQIPALRSNVVTSLLVERRGTLWAGTSDGTIINVSAQGAAAAQFPDAERYAGKWVNALAEDTEGALWAAFDSTGLVRLKDGQMQSFDPGQDLPATNVTQLLNDRAGHLWAVADGQLFVYEQQRWQPAGGTDAPDQPVRVICKAGDGGLWVATLATTGRGALIFKFNNGKWQRELFPYPWPQGSVRSRTQAILEDREGNLWCATAGGGVFFRPPEGSWRRLATTGTLSHSDALCFKEDEAGVIWIGTRTAGLHQVRPRAVRMFQLPADANQNVVLTVCARRDGSLWAGTEGAGVFRWRQNEPTHYGTEQGLDNLLVNALFEDSRSNLWAGTVGGLFRLQNDRFEPVEGSPALQTAVMSVFEDRQGRVWAGTRGGLARFSNGEVRLFTSLDGLGGAPVRALAEDGSGRLWVAIETAGLFRQEGERFERIGNIPDGLSSGARAMYCDDQGSMWFATRSSGLFRWKDGKLDEWNTQNSGLPSTRCFGLLEDNEGDLWISSESGIFGLAKNSLDASEREGWPSITPWRLTQADGLAHNVCTGGGQPAAARSSDGLLWFGNGPGVAVFDPATVPKGIRVWPPLIEDVLADGERLSVENTGGVRVKSGVAAFEFRYTSPNMVTPQRLKFRYQLVGVDKQWVEAGARRVAYYTHLLPRSYKFKVQAAAANGEWRDAMEDLAVVVVPRLHERRSVQFAAALLLLAAVAVTAWRMERNRSLDRLERLRMQNAMDKERQRIARDIHDDLGSGLTEIILLSDNLRDEMPSSPPGEKMVEEISTRARALTRTMDEVVWAVNPRNDTLESFLTYFNKFVQEYLNRAGVRCRMDVPLELPSMPLPAEVRHHLFLASKEALNNVVKHSGASEVWIRLQPGPGDFILSIEDNGRGFDTAVPPHRGNGLQNMQRRLEELEGRCEIHSKPGEGTRVAFQVNPRPAAGGSVPGLR